MIDRLGQSMLDTLNFLKDLGQAIEESNKMIIYTKNNCAQCKMTKLHLVNLGITDFEERNVESSEEYMQQALDTGYRSMPIVVIGEQVIASGFQPDRLNELV